MNVEALSVRERLLTPNTAVMSFKTIRVPSADDDIVEEEKKKKEITGAYGVELNAAEVDALIVRIKRLMNASMP
ncbi:hypothetical protein LSM04_002142 [Trypanosoma melophagium]|uniref:uncharacterized protein n=1 Tax=Trypanosoma melophagium TaxID=715481 RepID=UPI003519EB4B|nr:hypothetical protein LSM04_002142 [Trypanosoma melophagium]